MHSHPAGTSLVSDSQQVPPRARRVRNSVRFSWMHEKPASLHTWNGNEFVRYMMWDASCSYLPEAKFYCWDFRNCEDGNGVHKLLLRSGRGGTRNRVQDSAELFDVRMGKAIGRWCVTFDFWIVWYVLSRLLEHFEYHKVDWIPILSSNHIGRFQNEDWFRSAGTVNSACDSKLVLRVD